MRLARSSNGRAVALDSSPLATGGEARLFVVTSEPSLVAKIYHQPSPMRAAKLRSMIANPPHDPTAAQNHVSIAWPLDLLHAPGVPQSISGFLMPRIYAGQPIIDYYNPKSRGRISPLFSYRYLLRTAHNLAATVAAVHARGYVIGDVSESNILVTHTALVTLVDTDSFQVTDLSTGEIHRCPVGRAEFTPPELQGVRFTDVARSVEHDLFGLATVIFLLLMEGVHPFEGVFTGGGDPPPYEARIADGYFPHNPGLRSPYRPKPTAPRFDILHPELRTLFLRTFVDGHRDPRRRPDARNWQAALGTAESELVKCGENEQHLYRSGLHTCPWCERKQLLSGHDPFPSSTEVARRTAAAAGGAPTQAPLPPPGTLPRSARTVAPTSRATRTSPTPGRPATVPVNSGRRRRALTATLLSVFAPGLGHVFAGEARKGIQVYGGLLLVWIGAQLATVRVDAPPYNIVVPGLLLVATYVAGVVDAWRVTRRRRHTPKRYNRWFVYVGLFLVPVLFASLLTNTFTQRWQVAGQCRLLDSW